jgi:predicted DNA-binding ribbon-helix-helix protein
VSCIFGRTIKLLVDFCVFSVYTLDNLLTKGIFKAMYENLFKDEIKRKTSLMGRNVTILGRRTSIRLEPQMWDILFEVAERERTTIHEFCSLVALRKHENASLTSSIRVFLLLYYRAASSRAGHIRAGHGDFQNMVRRARVDVNLKTGESQVETTRMCA